MMEEQSISILCFSIIDVLIYFSECLYQQSCKAEKFCALNIYIQLTAHQVNRRQRVFSAKYMKSRPTLNLKRTNMEASYQSSLAINV